MATETLNGQAVTRLLAHSLHPSERQKGAVTLVIVDMQPPFLARCKDSQLIPSVVAQVKLAIARNWAIVLVEVKPQTYGATVRPILSLLEGKYQRFARVIKEGDDGSAEALAACATHSYPQEHFRVVGVLINACIASTAWGLVGRNKTCLVRVIKEACGTTQQTARAWASFKQGPRLVVSSHKIDYPLKCQCNKYIEPSGCEQCPSLFQMALAYLARLLSLFTRLFD
ncbi:MAG: hypothetical protein IPP57_09245 [Candidatus Obscuribacter sp.]|nr:hypothetical protein [Candidatus Obscuribacter sp.]